MSRRFSSSVDFCVLQVPEVQVGVIIPLCVDLLHCSEVMCRLGIGPDHLIKDQFGVLQTSRARLSLDGLAINPLSWLYFPRFSSHIISSQSSG